MNDLFISDNLIIGAHEDICDFFQAKKSLSKKAEALLDELVYFELDQRVTCTYDTDFGWYVEEC